MKNPIATIDTGKGEIQIKLYPDKAPNTVRSFIYCAKKGFYDGLQITRIVPDFVIQPQFRTQKEGADFSISGEYRENGFENSVPFRTGTVAMGAWAGLVSGSSFYIVLNDETGKKLDGRYPAFGQVIGGMDEIRRLEHLPLKPMPEPTRPGIAVFEPIEPEYIEKVTVETWGQKYEGPQIFKASSACKEQGNL